jgi:phage terminase large subunit
MPFDHYCAWLDERGYHGTDWYPHDAKVREAGSPGARRRIETLIAMGRKPELVPNEDVMEGVNAGRKTIPFARFDVKRCAQGLESLRSYRTEWDEKARAFKKMLDHNGPLTAQTLGATCRSRGARRCASRSRRRYPSAYLCRT